MMSNPIIFSFLPEIILLIGIFVFMIAGSFMPSGKHTYALQSLYLFILAAVFVALAYLYAHDTRFEYQQSIKIDALALLSKLALLAVVFVATFFCRRHLVRLTVDYFEFYTIILIALFGVFVAVSSIHLLTTYLAIELFSLAFYGLVALQKNDSTKSEVAIKYFVLGALASGFLLYGISMIYAQTGALSFEALSAWIEGRDAAQEPWFLLLGTLLFCSALAFKLGLFPLHQWMPDVYHGANTATVLYLSIIPKFAVGIIAIRFIDIMLPALSSHLIYFLTFMSMASILFGSVVALAQTNLKRLLAYSTVTHMGFFLLAFIGAELQGDILLFYLVAYIITNLLVFSSLLLLDTTTPDILEIKQLSGLAQTNPIVAFGLLIGFFSLAGIPPFIGFYAKLNVILHLVEQNLYLLAVVAVLLSVVAAFYYLRLIKVMFFDQPINPHPTQTLHQGSQLMLVAVQGALLLLSVFPQLLYSFTATAFNMP